MESAKMIENATKEDVLEATNTLRPPEHSLFGDRDVRTVLMDPPWLERGGGKSKRGADRHYPLLPTPQIPGVVRSCDHWDRLCDTAHCYMWVTNNFLEDGLWLMRELGFRYITNLVWTKDKMGLGQYFRGQHELLLFGVRGETILTDGTWSTWLGRGELKRTRHSEKPLAAYTMIEAASPGKWLEIFAREPRDGWLCWGNEIEASK